MKKIVAITLLFSLIFLSADTIKKVKSYEIEGRIHPIKIYKVCLEGVMYFILVDGYKAGMSPEYKTSKETGVPVLVTCKNKK